MLWYGSRHYDPELGRFISPDTIVPTTTQGVQAWDRYAYVNNDPTRFVDPTGHYASCYGQHIDDGPQCTKGGWINNSSDVLYSNEKYQNRVRDELKQEVQNGINNLIWRTTPSAVGLDFGVNPQTGLVMEAGYTPIEIQILYNWRAKQLSILQGSGSNAYLGSPTLIGGTGYLGIMTVYGASDNKYVAGPSRYGGVTGAADVFGKLGINKVGGYSANLENGVPLPFVDPESKIPVTFRQTNIIAGGNLFPDGIDLGFLAGESYSVIKWNWP